MGRNMQDLMEVSGISLGRLQQMIEKKNTDPERYKELVNVAIKEAKELREQSRVAQAKVQVMKRLIQLY